LTELSEELNYWNQQYQLCSKRSRIKTYIIVGLGLITATLLIIK
jgi:hypothetical protein